MAGPAPPAETGVPALDSRLRDDDRDTSAPRAASGHAELPFSWHLDQPDFVLAIPADERLSRVELRSDECVIEASSTGIRISPRMKKCSSPGVSRSSPGLWSAARRSTRRLIWSGAGRETRAEVAWRVSVRFDAPREKLHLRGVPPPFSFEASQPSRCWLASPQAFLDAGSAHRDEPGVLCHLAGRRPSALRGHLSVL